jgi:hypothetical protein
MALPEVSPPVMLLSVQATTNLPSASAVIVGSSWAPDKAVFTRNSAPYLIGVLIDYSNRGWAIPLGTQGNPSGITLRIQRESIGREGSDCVRVDCQSGRVAALLYVALSSFILPMVHRTCAFFGVAASAAPLTRAELWRRQSPPGNPPGILRAGCNSPPAV